MPRLKQDTSFNTMESITQVETPVVTPVKTASLDECLAPLSIQEEVKAEPESKGLDSEDDRMVTLISESGDRFTLKVKAAIKSIFIKTALDLDKEATEVNCKVSTGSLKCIVQWMEAHEATSTFQEYPRPLPTVDITKVVEDKFDVDFIKQIKTYKELFKLTEDCNYMDLKPLLYLCAVRLASLFKGKTKDECDDIIKKALIQSPTKPSPTSEAKEESKEDSKEDSKVETKEEAKEESKEETKEE